MSLLKDLVTSKKFIVSVLTTLLAIGTRYVPELEHMDATELAALLSPLLAYIVGQGIADSGKEAAKVQKRSGKN